MTLSVQLKVCWNDLNHEGQNSYFSAIRNDMWQDSEIGCIPTQIVQSPVLRREISKNAMTPVLKT